MYKNMAKNPGYITANEHLFPIIDIVVDDGIEMDEAEISCFKGCSHCCHLLIEITWEEALELAHWVKHQEPEAREKFTNKVLENAKEARRVFQKIKGGSKFTTPYAGDDEIPEDAFDEYFYRGRRPCPFLENDVCGAYTHRPSPCRFHVVTTPAENCTAEYSEAGEEVESPESVDNVKDELGNTIAAVNPDERWGHFGIMVEAAMKELEVI